MLNSKKLRMKYQRPPEVVDMAQPLLEAIPFLTRSKNILTAEEVSNDGNEDIILSSDGSTTQPPPQQAKTYLIPQGVRLFPLGHQSLRQARCLLSVLWRVENFSRVRDLHESTLSKFLPLTMKNSEQLLEAVRPILFTQICHI